MSISTPATRFLDLHSIPYQIFEHPVPPFSIQQAARERGQTPEQVVRSILFRYDKKSFFMTLVAGPGQISWRKLRAYLGITRISMATEDEVLSVTGDEVGTVSPLGLLHPVRILGDNKIFTLDEISIGSGLKGVAIIMKSAGLRLALGEIEIGQFC